MQPLLNYFCHLFNAVLPSCYIRFQKFIQERKLTVDVIETQEAQLSLTNRPTLVHADAKTCSTHRSCPLVNGCDLLDEFFDFYLPFFHMMPSMRGIPSSYRVHIWYEKTRMAGLQSGEGRIMIDSVVWAQYINVTDTQTATSR